MDRIVRLGSSDLLPGGTGGDRLPPTLEVGEVIEGIGKGRDAEKIVEVSKEGNVSESEVFSSDVGVGRELLVQNGEVSIKLGSELRDARFIGSSSTHDLEDEFADNISDRAVVGLIDRKPLLNDRSLLQVRRIQRVGSMLGSHIAKNSTGLEQLEITIDEGRNLAERLILLQIGGRLVLTSSEIYSVDFVLHTDLLEGSSHGKGASRLGNSFNLVDRHIGQV